MVYVYAYINLCIFPYMYVGRHVYVYIDIYTYYTHVYIHGVYICLHVCRQTYMVICMYVSTKTHITEINMYAHIIMSVCILMYTYMHAYIHLYVCIYEMCMNIHAYIHMSVYIHVKTSPILLYTVVIDICRFVG